MNNFLDLIKHPNQVTKFNAKKYGFIVLLAVEVSDPSLDNAIVDVFFGLNVALMTIIAGVFVFILIFRKNRYIRNSGLHSCLLILIGLFFIGISEIFMCITLTSAICYLIDIFLLIGVSFVISTLAAKLYRIYRIFRNATAQAIKITDRDLFIFTFIITVGTMIIFTLYVTIGGGLQPIIMAADSNPLYLFKICLVPDDTIQKIALISFYVYFISLFIAAGILAVLTRKTMKDFNESWDVGFVVYSWIGITLVYAPIYYVQGFSTNSNETRHVVRFIGIALVQTLTLGFLFLNKIIKVIKYELKSRTS